VYGRGRFFREEEGRLAAVQFDNTLLREISPFCYFQLFFLIICSAIYNLENFLFCVLILFCVRVRFWCIRAFGFEWLLFVLHFVLHPFDRGFLLVVSTSGCRLVKPNHLNLGVS
jgi:hypothetical protein